MRIMWLSNAPWAATGYGNQTRVFVPRIKELGHEIAITAFYGLDGGVINWNGIPVFPKGIHPYGQDVVRAHAQAFGADVIISLVDVWVCNPAMIAPMPWVAWFPIDSDPVSPAIIARATGKRLMFSRHSCKMLDSAGLDYDYIPHGVETDIFRPMDMSEARAKLRESRLPIPNDAFLVSMVAANKGNPSRKAFDSQFAGFAQFAKRHKGAILYVHSTKAENGENQGVNLPQLAEYHGLEIGKNILFVDQYQNLLGCDNAYMQAVYAGADVSLMATMGEGFGIPIVEAQACGCPVIVGDWTANAELCFGGWKIDKSESVPMWTALGTYQYHVKPEAVASALEKAYRAKGNKDYRRSARAGALNYDADKITREYWQPYLERLAAELKA